MSLKISPNSKLSDMILGEDVTWSLTLTQELRTNTIASHTFKIYNSSEDDVTSTLGGGSLESSGVITYGIKAIAIGIYTIKFWIICNELLPDGITPKKFLVTLTSTIK